jgi:hypothetical protein
MVIGGLFMDGINRLRLNSIHQIDIMQTKGKLWQTNLILVLQQ